MQVRGLPYERFESGNGQASDLHLALFARDAVLASLADAGRGQLGVHGHEAAREASTSR